MEKIFISACLLGENVRYHGGNEKIYSPLLELWRTEGRIISIRPEVSAGASVSRPPSEIVGLGGGAAVKNNLAHVIKRDGTDCSEQYLAAAQIALDLIRLHRIRVALLKDNSPSCGSRRIYDGSFAGTKISGSGVTAAALVEAGVKVFTESEIELADSYLRQLQ